MGLFLGTRSSYARQSGWNLFLERETYFTRHLPLSEGFADRNGKCFVLVECVYFFVVVVSWEWSGELLP